MRRWTRRPITPAERGPIFVAASLVLTALAAGTLLLHPRQPPTSRTATGTRPPVSPRPADPQLSVVASRTAALADARAFAAGYLAYLYQGADAQTIPDVSIELRRALAHRPPRSGRRPRARHVRLLDVQLRGLDGRRARAVATAVDESGATFPIRLRLRALRTGGWEVSGLGR